MNSIICLPPRIAGTPKATLEVRIDLLKSSAAKTSCSNTETAKFIKLIRKIDLGTLYLQIEFCELENL